MMITLSEGAKRSLEDYLREARAYLRSSKSVDADEVEQNVTEHIETELEGVPEPVSCDDLDVVLKKLGSPQQWVPTEELAWWRLIILRLRNGPEDWRLAYLSFGLLVFGCILPWTFPLLATASFIVSRAALSELGDPKELMAQKWEFPEYLKNAISHHHNGNVELRVDPSILLVSFLKNGKGDSEYETVINKSEEFYQLKPKQTEQFLCTASSEAEDFFCALN